jgi:3-deoxy-D-manno-octulosonate 8-phosphate phosphatase (KDO 8-P phosphatase)
MSAEAAARAIQMLICDVDGVFTDGGLYYDAQGKISKRFHVQDGLGVKLAQAAGLQVAVITGLESEAVKLRFQELGVQEYHAGQLGKLPALQDICRRHNLESMQLAYLGDDWVDAQIMGRVGLPMAVCNAQPEILNIAAWISSSSGGHGAVREAIRFILQAQGKWQGLWSKWVD